MNLSQPERSKPDEYILIINTAINHYLGIAILKNRAILARNWRSVKYKQSEKLLTFIDTVLVKNGLKAQDLSAIVVVTGPGSFTAVRLGVLAANTWGLVLDIPVIDYVITQKKFLNKEKWNLRDWRKLLIQIQNKVEDLSLADCEFKPVLPVYEGEANIG